MHAAAQKNIAGMGLKPGRVSCSLGPTRLKATRRAIRRAGGNTRFTGACYTLRSVSARKNMRGREVLTELGEVLFTRVKKGGVKNRYLFLLNIDGNNYLK